jgi:predicted MFS family arabinose efflux permease
MPLRTETAIDLPARERSRVIVLLACAAFSGAAAFRVCDPQLPQLARQFGTTTGDAALAVTSFSLAYGALQLIYGPLGDRYGKFRVVVAATCACTVASIGCALSNSLESLVFFRGLAGAAAAPIVPMSMAWIGDAVAYDQRQTWLARFLTGTILGMAFGQLVGGLFADILGWQSAFAVLAAIYLTVGGLLIRELRRTRPDRAPNTIETASEQPTRMWFRQRAVLVKRWPRVILATVCAEGAIVFGSLAFVPTLLHSRFGVSLTAAGAIAAAYAFGGLAYTFFARRLITALGERALGVAGGLTLCFAFGLYAVAPSWYVGLLASVTTGLGFYMLHSVLQTHATQMAPAARGTAVSLFSAALFMGQSAGVAVGGALVNVTGIAFLFSASAAASPILAFLFSRRLKSHRTHARVACSGHEQK